jgi:hypothetical protein
MAAIVETCPGRLIEHADGTFAGCTLGVACRVRALPHEGEPIRCSVWWRDGCDYCGTRHEEAVLIERG